MATNIEQRWANINLDNDLQSTPTTDNQNTTTGLASKVFSLDKARQDKINTLSGKPQETTDPYKVNDLSRYQDVTITGMEDADTAVLADGRKVRLSTPLTRYDATEIEHPESLWGKVKNTFGIGDVNKSDYATEQQRRQAAMVLGKQPTAVTDQDLIDVGNMQQVQMLSDLTRSQGQDRWEAPLVPNAGQVDLNQGLDIKTKLKVDNTDMYGRVVGSFVNPETGIDVVKQHAEDPRLNAFAPEARNYGYTRDAEGRRVDTLDTDGYWANQIDALQYGAGRAAASTADTALEAGLSLAKGTITAFDKSVEGGNYEKALERSLGKDVYDAKKGFVGLDKFKKPEYYGYTPKNVDAVAKAAKEFYKNPTVGGFADLVVKSGKAGPEVLLTSVPEIVASRYKVGLLAVSGNFANDILDARAEAKGGIENIDASDRMYSLVGGSAAGILNKLSGGNIGYKEAAEGLAKLGGAGYKDAIVTGIYQAAKSMNKEGLEEVAQGRIVELASVLDTVKEESIGSEKFWADALTDYSLGASAGGVGHIAGTVLRRETQEEKQAKIEAANKAAEAEVKANMKSVLDMAGEVPVGANDLKIEENLGVDSMSRIYSSSQDVDSMLGKMSTAKEQLIDSVYERDDQGSIIGIKDESKVEDTMKWLEEYAQYQADKDGNVPKAVRDELDYVRRMNAEFETFGGAIAPEVQAKVGEVQGRTEEQLKADIDTQVDNILKEYALDTDENAESIKEDITARVRKAYDISGMAGLGNNVNIEIDKEAIANEARGRAGLKTGGLDQRVTSREGKVVEPGSITNEEMLSVMRGEGTAGGIEHPNTKHRERVLKRLDPLTRGNVTETLADVGTKMESVLDANEAEAGKYLKGGDVRGNMMRLMALTANRINSQVASDTEGRTETDYTRDNMLKGDEYWASKNGVIEQAGKDYLTSYGLKLTGDAIELAKIHRNLGRFGLKMLEDAGLVESTQEDMWSKAGDIVDASGRPLSTTTKGVGIAEGKDKLTGDKVVLVKDKGVRLKDTSEMDPVRGYESKMGDAIKRLSKLMLPNAERVPSNTYIERPLKVAEGITIDKQTEDAIKERMKKPLYMKMSGHMYDTLKQLKELNESTPGGLAAAIRKDASLKRFLLLEDTGSELLKVSDKGSIQSKLDNLIGILDNLDTLASKDGVYFTFQVDINDRLTVQESVANYQSDKVYARQILGVGEYTTNNQAEKDILVGSIVDDIASSKQTEEMDELSILNEYANLLDKMEERAKTDGKVDPIRLAKVIANNTNPGYKLSHLKSLGGIRILSLLEAARDVRNAGDSVNVTTEYIPEKDASASGVFNTTINISGRNPKHSEKRLMELGTAFTEEIDGKKVTKELPEEQQVDAYKILGNIIDKLIKALDLDDNVAGVENEDNLRAVKKINDTLDDPKLLRNLAKYPIMTWFYSAEEKSIVANLTKEFTYTLVEKALDGDAKALEYIADVTGKPGMTIEDVRMIKKGDADHRALRAELDKIGKVYYDKLNEAFPEVKANKEEMQGYFQNLVENSTVNGVDYWGGKVRTALGALHKTDETMSLYKWKSQAVDMKPQDKIDSGLATPDESLYLTTTRKKMANVTSLMALMMHSVDAAQAIESQMAITSDKGLQSKHDGFSGTPQDLIEQQKRAEPVTVEIANAYDLQNEMAWAMRNTAKEMRKAAEKATPANAKELSKKADNLEKMAERIEAKNNPRMEAKAELLKNAQTRLFGKTGYVTEETTKAEPKKSEEVKKEVKEQVYTDIVDLIESLDGVDERVESILTSGVKMVTLDDAKVKELLGANKLVARTLKKYTDSGRSFTYKGTVYIGSRLLAKRSDIDTRKEELTAEQVLDVVSHEVEHAIADDFISKEYDGKIVKETKALEKLLGDITNRGVKVNTKLPKYTQARVNYILEQRSPDKAIKEMVAMMREEEVASDVYKELNRLAGREGNIVERLIKAIWDKIQALIESTPLDVLLDKADVYTLGVAIKSIQDKARGLESKGIAKAEDVTINTDKTPFDEDFVSEVMSKIDPMC